MESPESYIKTSLQHFKAKEYFKAKLFAEKAYSVQKNQKIEKFIMRCEELLSLQRSKERLEEDSENSESSNEELNKNSEEKLHKENENIKEENQKRKEDEKSNSSRQKSEGKEQTTEIEENKILEEVKKEENLSNSENPRTESQLEDEALGEEIIRKKNYYEILSLPKDCSEEDIKREYKILARRFHPDKSKFSKAIDVFQKIGLAYSCLSDPEKREFYDKHGKEREFLSPEEKMQYAKPMDAREIFEYAMFGTIPKGKEYLFRKREHPPQKSKPTPPPPPEQQSSTKSKILQIIFVIGSIIIAYLYLAGDFTPEPTFVVEYKENYPFKEMTYNRKVPFYTKQKVIEKKGFLDHFESEIEAAYKTFITEKCFTKRAEKNQLQQILESDISIEETQNIQSKIDNLELNECKILKDKYNE